jgi:hypothetical protein
VITERNTQKRQSQMTLPSLFDNRILTQLLMVIIVYSYRLEKYVLAIHIIT